MVLVRFAIEDSPRQRMVGPTELEMLEEEKQESKQSEQMRMPSPGL